MPKIVLDAGHGGKDPGAVYEGRQEKDDVLRLALAVGDLLEKDGFDVVYTRTEDIYESPFQKAQEANASGADYLVSLHRNAVPTPGSATGIETLVFADQGEPAALARSINQELTSIGFLNRGVIERPNLTVLKRSEMPAVLVEAGFIDNEEDNEKFDASFDEIAQAIADGIASYVLPESDDTLTDQESGQTLSYQNPYQKKAPKLYRVQVGAFRNQAPAYQLNTRLTEDGFPSFLLLEDGLYKVQVGAFARLENAIRMEYQLRAAGYNTYITT